MKRAPPLRVRGVSASAGVLRIAVAASGVGMRVANEPVVGTPIDAKRRTRNPQTDENKTSAAFKEAEHRSKVQRAIYEEERKMKTHHYVDRSYDRGPANTQGAVCGGCGWPSSRFETRRAFKAHREVCE